MDPSFSPKISAGGPDDEDDDGPSGAPVCADLFAIAKPGIAYLFALELGGLLQGCWEGAQGHQSLQRELPRLVNHVRQANLCETWVVLQVCWEGVQGDQPLQREPPSGPRAPGKCV